MESQLYAKYYNTIDIFSKLQIMYRKLYRMKNMKWHSDLDGVYIRYLYHIPTASQSETWIKQQNQNET